MAPPTQERAEIDQVLGMLERRGLSLGELRLLLRLFYREGSLADIGEALDKPVSEIWRTAGRLSRRGLVRWYHVRPRDETRLTITKDGRATVRALLPLRAGASAPDRSAGRQ
jgi:DNA-binding MarR family transcriptional regulator